MIYEVWLTLRSNTYYIEADSEEEAFHKAADKAIDCVEWLYSVKPQERGHKMAMCNIYKNLWAGYDCYFIRMHTNGRMATGIKIHNAYGDWRVTYNTQFYAQDVKDPVHFPVVGKIDIDQSIISAVLATVEEQGAEK